MKQVKVISPGLFTSVQDEGRKGFAHWGIPTAGAMDRGSLHRVNALLGNPNHAAVLETTFVGPLLEFEAATAIAICGAQAMVQLNGQEVPQNQRINVTAGDQVRIGKSEAGVRSYLGVEGGFLTDTLLGSRSWTRGLTNSFRLQKGELLSIGNATEKKKTNRTIEATPLDNLAFEVLPGPEFSWLSPEQQEQLFSQSYRLTTSSNRMAFSFTADPILPHSEVVFLTSPVLPGIVQWYPNGQLVLLHRDAQRTGGYPRILIFDNHALDQIAQLKIDQAFQLKKP